MRHIINPQVVNGWFNQFVDTPLGKGWVFGKMILKDAHQEGIETRVLVRLPVNEKTVEHLSAPNCLTPRAQKTALFTFSTSEVG